MENEELQLTLSLRDEQLISLNFLTNDISNEEPNIFSINKIKVVDDFHLEIRSQFIFEDLGFNIKGEISRAIDIEITGTEELKENYKVLDFVDKEKKELLMPLASKASKLIADITDNAYIFPLLVPPTEWISNEKSEIDILTENK